jgi:anaerobic selenocysteine-containing dehydrogenase
VTEAIAGRKAEESDARVEPSFCRQCLGFCGINVTIKDGRVTKVAGDTTSPLTQGFTCSKGRAFPETLARKDRLLCALHRDESGALVSVPSSIAAVEAADRLWELVEHHGPRSVALYIGTGSSGYAGSIPTGNALWRALGSSMNFNPGAIDQPGKGAAAALHGRWAGGAWTPAEASVWTFIGTNPLVTMWAGTGMYNPGRQLREGRKRGMRIVVIDPRRTEVAAFADVHLAVRPGEDPVVLAGLLRLLFYNGRVDEDFVNRHAVGLDELRSAVEPFTVDVVAARAGIAGADLEAAAEIIGSSRRGGMSAGTGANMSPRSTLTEYLLLAVYTVCGYWRREGDPLGNPGVLIPPQQWKEQPLLPLPGMYGSRESVRDGAIVVSAAGLQTGLVAEDILGDAPDRIRALLNVGGNPLTAWPGHAKVRAAMERLELLVSFDVGMSATAAMSHVVFGTKFHLEVANITGNETIRSYGAACEGFPIPFAMYSPAVVEPPAGSDLVEEWEVFHAIARRLGLPLVVNGIDLAAIEKPTSDQVLDAVLRMAVVGLDELRRYPRGNVFDVAAVVGPPDRDRPDDLRLRLGERAALEGLDDVLDKAWREAPFRLVVRRTVQMKNSWGNDLPTLAKWFPYANPVWMHPDDMATLAVQTGDAIEIRSAHGTIRCLAEEDDTQRSGVVSVSHGWGGPGRAGANVNELTDDLDFGDPITAIPHMSSLPVWLEPVRPDNPPEPR